MKKTSLCVCVCVLVLEGVVGLCRTSQLQLLWHQWLGHRLGLLYVEWFALETNRDYSVIFEIAPKYCILDSFVTMRVTPFFPKGCLPMVVDIMVI